MTNRSLGRCIGFLMLVGWMGSTTIQAQAQGQPRLRTPARPSRENPEPLRKVFANNPYAQEVIELATELRRQYDQFFRASRGTVVDQSRLMTRLARYHRTYRLYYTAVEKYRVEEARPVTALMLLFTGSDVNPTFVSDAVVELTDAPEKDTYVTSSDAFGNIVFGGLVNGRRYPYRIMKEGFKEARGVLVASRDGGNNPIQLALDGGRISLNVFRGNTEDSAVTRLQGAAIMMWKIPTEKRERSRYEADRTAYGATTAPHAGGVSDQYGSYVLDVPHGRYWVRIEFVGHDTAYYEIDADAPSDASNGAEIVLYETRPIEPSPTTASWIPDYGSNLDDPFTLPTN